MNRYVCIAVVLSMLPAVARGQSPPSGQGGMPMPGHEQHQAMPMAENPLGIPQARDGSGTSWLPDASPMQGVMRHRGPWMLMLHGNAFAQYIHAGGDRGDEQFGSINWLMGMTQRSAGGGQIQLRGMFSLEPLTVGRCGYPNVLQTGEFCRGEPLHDRQHPHDLFMELAVQYRRAMSDTIAFELYGGAAAEPAIGPTAFPHRLSAMPNPVAPISHHWLDSSHISFGVLTGGVYGRKWKAEASVFNGREPDDRRYNLDLDVLDSFSGRFWFAPSPEWSLQVSAGHLEEAEIHEDEFQNVDRLTASVTHHRLLNGRVWATTLAWGRNREKGHADSVVHHDVETTSAFTVETALDVTARDTLFARADVTEKTAADLVLPVSGDEMFTVSKLQAGYTRWLTPPGGLRAGLGGSAALAVVPAALSPFYGGRTTPEFSIYFTVRP